MHIVDGSFRKKSKRRLYLIFLWVFACGCSLSANRVNDRPVLREKDRYDYSKKFKIRCRKNSPSIVYEIGDTPCWEKSLVITKDEHLEIHFKVVDENSEDIYQRGYQELLRVRDGKSIEKLKLRKEEDAYWNDVPFVRIRKQKYLADLDGDGYLEFALFPWSPGSAIWGTVRIFSLKEKIEYWGEGRYQFEGDTFVQLGCMDCSKFNPEACRKCR